MKKYEKEIKKIIEIVKDYEKELNELYHNSIVFNLKTATKIDDNIFSVCSDLSVEDVKYNDCYFYVDIENETILSCDSDDVFYNHKTHEKNNSKNFLDEEKFLNELEKSKLTQIFTDSKEKNLNVVLNIISSNDIFIVSNKIIDNESLYSKIEEFSREHKKNLNELNIFFVDFEDSKLFSILSNILSNASQDSKIFILSEYIDNISSKLNNLLYKSDYKIIHSIYLYDKDVCECNNHSEVCEHISKIKNCNFLNEKDCLKVDCNYDSGKDYFCFLKL